MISTLFNETNICLAFDSDILYIHMYTPVKIIIILYYWLERENLFSHLGDHLITCTFI